jgi:hypothetical protein
MELFTESIRGEGEDVIFSDEEIEADRIRQTEICEKSMRKERMRQAKAAEAASRIYITI